MTQKPPLLINNPVAYTGTMQTLDEEFTLHRLWKAKDKLTLARSVADACRVIVTPGHDEVPAELLDAAPKLGLVACFGVGYDAIDVPMLTKRGIRVTNTPDVLTEEVADLALALLLAITRRVVKADRYVRSGDWEAKGNMDLTPSLTGGKTVGIVGLGRIGKAIAKRCAAFNLTVVYHGRQAQNDVPYRHYPDLVAMSREVDFLILSCPGGAATRHIVNAAVLAALGPKGILVNVSRGSVVDEAALAPALVSGRLGGAALDVFHKEPCRPFALSELTENVVLSPHQASATHETRGAMGRVMIDNIKAFLAGKTLLTPVN
ncbi:MAG: 2-hydroxyacid dehydrogenase [Proteobacteria bacterium]|nr:2-hydroxyacid dehydrogenase [Pseudomonadota bacterium]MBI3499124.1 2-hydroxyacid dehydrogenase [Pseudomonadota bacterium]